MTLFDDATVAVIPGACLPAQIAEMTAQTTQGLLDLVGDIRIGPVEHRHVHGRDECTRLLHAMFADDERPIARFGLDQFDAFFRDYPAECVLIVASCKVSRRLS